MALVRFENIVKRYGDVEVIKGIPEMTINDGEFVSIVGPSGCGKSTLLRMVCGLEEISEGKLYIGDRVANDVQPKDRGLAMVFQSYALFPHMTVEANIAFGLKIKKVPEEEKRKKVDWAIKLLQLDNLGDRLPKELSGGQRQRVAIARALVLDPEILLLDEPLSNLDAKLRLQMRTEFKRLHKKVKSTTIYVTHDQVEAMTLSDRIAVLHNGIVQQYGSPMEVYNNPANMFVAGFIGSPAINFVTVDIVKENGEYFLYHNDLKIGVPALKVLIVEKYSNGDELIMGIRPQDIFEANDPKVSGLKDNIIKTQVDVTEPLGDQIIVVVRVGEITIKALMPNDVKAEPGSPIELAVNTNNIHLFEPETTKALF